MCEVKEIILEKYRSEAACAKVLGWPRQRLNKITTGKKTPDIDEVNCLSVALDVDVGRLIRIFLRQKSTNEQLRRGL